MKTIFKRSSLNLSVLIAACLPYTAVNAVVLYSVSDLGNLGGTYSEATAVNRNGLAVGFSHLPDNVSENAIVGDGLAAPSSLGTLGGSYSQAYGINNLGQVVGSSYLTGDALYHGFKWQGPGFPPLTPLTDLHALVNPGYSRALSINDSGIATGFSLTAAGTEHAVKWSATGVITDLGTLNATNTGNSYAVDINAAGVAAGYSSLTTSKFSHAVRWNTDGTKLDLGTLGGNHSAAYGINASGGITGSSTTTADAAQHAFIWAAGQTPSPMRDLGTLGGQVSEGFDISDLGDVVGTSSTAAEISQKAFLWQAANGMQDLNTLIDPALGWTLIEARGISDDGQYITGVGKFNNEYKAFLLSRLILDTTPPIVSFTLTPSAPSASGWYVVLPSLTWSVTDPETAVTTRTGCVDTAAIANTAPAGTTFSCSATSAGGTSTPVVTPVIKVDTVAPVLTGVPVAFTQQATSTTGAMVTYTLPTASDANSGVKAPGVSCLPASGTAFQMGDTTVNCSVSDNAGNSATASFIVSVKDLTPPTVVFNISPVAPSASGWYLVSPSTSWTVTDSESTVTRTGCATVAAQANTGIGGRNVSCTATSAGGTTGPITHNIKVDTVAPTLTGVPANITQTTTSATGAAVTYALPIASDATPGSGLSGTVSCLPASGSIFPVGVTTVACSAKDVAGNSASASFTVTVNRTDSTPPVVNVAIAPAAPTARAASWSSRPAPPSPAPAARGGRSSGATA